MKNAKRNKEQTKSNTLKTYTVGIKGRIFTGFIAIAVILIITTFFINSKIKVATDFAANISQVDFPTVDSFLDINGFIYQSQAALSNYIITRNEKFKAEFLTTWVNADNTIIKIDKFSKFWNNADINNTWQTSKSLLNDLKESETNLLTSIPTLSQAAIANTLANTIQPKINHVLDILDGPIQSDKTRYGGLYNKAYNSWESSARDTTTSLNNVSYLQDIVLIFYIFAATVIAIITARSIIIPLNAAINIARKIANGERNLEINNTSNDEAGVLLEALDTMQEAIQENERKLRDGEIRTRTLFDNIVKTANAFSEHSSRISKGDLTQRVAIDSNAEMNQLGKDLNAMTENLATITHRITEACHNMVSTLEEVKQSVEVQSTGASEQASSINEITASLEEIEKSSSQTIDKAKTLGEVAERTRDQGQQGLEAVEQSVQGMKSIREKVQTIAQTILDLSNQTQQVGEITHVVNTLAQQSKMLALNASIEAAKAGEAGKGFAVVAAEVKNLAEQSEQSTSQVQKILEDIRHATEKAVMATEEGTKGVDEGTILVEQTGDVVRNLSNVIHETTIASEQIAAAIRQEGVGIEQITAGMNEINQVTSTFVASVKQTTEAIDDLATIAKNLKEYIDIYKI